jgi:hypothetical protein
MNLMARGFLSAIAVCTIALGEEPEQQTQQPAPATATTTPAPAAEPQKAFHNFTWKGIKLSGILDGYYAYNANDPASGKNATRAFDTEANAWDLNMLKFAIDKAPEPVGFRLDLGLGRAFDVFQFYEPTRRVEQLLPVMQAYVAFKPKSWNGLQIDVGKFYTAAGAEVTESHLNWNYSRGLLYNNGPFFHFGIRATKPVTKEWTLGGQLINGWNNVADNNSGKTVGITSLWTRGKVTIGNNYYVGPEKSKTSKGFRHFIDNVLVVNTSDKNSFFVNFDYGVDRGIAGAKGSKWAAISFADRYQITKKVFIAGRVEWYNDMDGFITTVSQKLKSYTITGEYKWVDGLITRLEWRNDNSNYPFFDRRAGLTNIKHQNTIVLGFIGYFGPKS